MCVFCSIIKGDIPSKKVYEDDDTLAILDISQTTCGHTLVMPKKHYENLNDDVPAPCGLRAAVHVQLDNLRVGR